MFYQSVTLPAPFYRIELFTLIEPAGETDSEIKFSANLYLVNRSAEGGKVLLMNRHAYSVSKVEL